MSVIGLARAAAASAVCAALVSACTLGGPPDPYEGAPPPPGAEPILESLDLTAAGLRIRDCNAFDAPLARCYQPERWLTVREGREAFAQVHSELTALGAQYWGSSESELRGEPVQAGGLELGCYADYAAIDHMLRVALVGPSGESTPCVNGLPGDGVSQVWVIAMDAEPRDLYAEVTQPESWNFLFGSVRVSTRSTGVGVYGGPGATAAGYVGPELPALTDGRGLAILADTVAVRDGVVRGLVQYRGGATAQADEADDASAVGDRTPPPVAVDVVIAVGGNEYAVPMPIRVGESLPFEIALPKGLGADDLRIVPTWSHAADDGRPGQLLHDPARTPGCGAEAGPGRTKLAELTPGKGRVCVTAIAQATTSPGVMLDAVAVAARFNEDGTVRDVYDVYFVRDNGGAPSLTKHRTADPTLRTAWIADDAEGAALWVRYAKVA